MADRRHLVSGVNLDRLLLIIAVCLSISLLHLAMFCKLLGPLIFIAYVPVLYCLMKEPQQYLLWFLVGFMVRLGEFVFAPLSFIAWGKSLMFVPWLMLAFISGIGFVLTILTFQRLPRQLEWLAFPSIFIVITSVLGMVGVPFFTPSAALAIEYPDLLSSARYFGIWGTDFIILSINAIFAWLSVMRHSGSVLYLVFFSLIILICRFADIPTTKDTIYIKGIQPALTTAQIQSQNWSLAARSRNVELIDRLTRQALQEQKSTVVLLPEGSNDLYNKRLPLRRLAIQAMFRHKDSELLLATKDLTPEGHLRNMVSHVTYKGFHEDAIKSNPAPFSESNFKPGKPTAIKTQQGNLGILICYDSIFSGNYHALINQGAEAFIITTDDSSFHGTLLSRVHVAFSIANTIESGRPMIYLSNYGPALSTDVYGKIIQVDWQGDKPGIYDWEIKTQAEDTFAHQGGRFIAVIISVMVLILALKQWIASKLNTPKRLTTPGISFRFTLVLIVLPGIFSIFSWSTVASSIHNTTINRLLTDIYQQNYLSSGQLDGIAPAFKQSTDKSCGAAAIAYLLTYLGDMVFEHDVLKTIEASHEDGYSFDEMARFTATRGFNAKGYFADKGVFEHSPFMPVIAHMSMGHYIVVLKLDGENLFYFDPAYGRTFNIGKRKFLDEWSGKFLTVSTTEPDILLAPGL